MIDNKPPLDFLSISTILNSLDALVYVSDMDTYEMIFMNNYGERYWGQWNGKRCWQVLQAGQNRPCSFCNNHLLRHLDGTPSGIVVWEFQNTVTGRWYQCRDQAIPWIDGRTVRIEIAFDITHTKQMETELILAQQRAEQLALIDPLTELGNRRSFFEEANQLFKQASRFVRPLSVAMIDIDYFKRINDGHGHLVGDNVIRQVACAIRECLRDVDVAGRIGGEEFGVVLPETYLADALIICERLRDRIEHLGITVDGADVPISCSFGIASLSPSHTEFDDLLAAADQALYQAKNRGRNRIEFSPPHSG